MKNNKNKDLTPIHKQFVNEYFANGLNATKAYLNCYPNCTYKSANTNGTRLLVTDSIQTEIQKKFIEIQEQSKTTISDITDKLHKIIEDCQRDNDRTNLLRALDLLAKMIGAYAPKKIEQINQQPLQINIINPNQN